MIEEKVRNKYLLAKWVAGDRRLELEQRTRSQGKEKPFSKIGIKLRISDSKMKHKGKNIKKIARASISKGNVT